MAEAEEMPNEETAPKDPIVAPKENDILFYYLKYEGDKSVDKIKLKLEVLEYPSGDSFRDVKAKVLEVIESSDDEIKKGDEDIFDLADLDPKDMPIDEFIPYTVDQLLEFSKSQEPVKKEETQEQKTNKEPTATNQSEAAIEPEVANESEEANEAETANESKESKKPDVGKESEAAMINESSNEPEGAKESKNSKRNKPAAKGGSRRRKTPRKSKQSKKRTRKSK